MKRQYKAMQDQIKNCKEKLIEIEKNVISCYPMVVQNKIASENLIKQYLHKTQLAKKVCEQILTSNTEDCSDQLSYLKFILKDISANTRNIVIKSYEHTKE